MKISRILHLVILLTVFRNYLFAQDPIFPKIMIDVSYANKYSAYINCTKLIYSGGDISVKLKNNVELNFMKSIGEIENSRKQKIFVGLGVCYSEYQINRNIYLQQDYSGHFSPMYTYSPSKLDYDLESLKFQIHLSHYAFLKKIMFFQKVGLCYTSFFKKSTANTEHTEQYGNAYPVKDLAHATPSNPDGWYLAGNYTFTNKNDMSIYKNGVTAFYKCGLGVRIKNVTPFIGFETSNVSGKFWSTYVKGQIGLNYSFIKP